MKHQTSQSKWRILLISTAGNLVIGIFIIRKTSFNFILPYVDPSLVLIVVLISISVPVRMAWRALMELLNRTPSPKIVQEVDEIVRKCTARLPVQALFVRVVQPGRTRIVLTHVVLPSDFHVGGLPFLDTLRSETLKELKAAHTDSALDMIFTADPDWGAPSG